MVRPFYSAEKQWSGAVVLLSVFGFAAKHEALDILTDDGT